MTLTEFRALFLKNIEGAVAKAQALSSRNLPTAYLIELHGTGVAGQILQFDEALGRIFISELEFFPIIDVGLKKVRNGKSIVFVRVSAFPVGSFEEAWNIPPGNGPFKIIEPIDIPFEN